MSEVNAVDLAFVVDTTGSMAGLIDAAQRHMIAIVEGLVHAADVDLRLGVVEYRDHPPQDRLVSRAHAFTPDLDEAQRTIRGLAAKGGGDGPEAVLDGLVAACRGLAWRPHARRLAVLVGDSPPHGIGAGGDAFAGGCPCGETIASASAMAEEARVTVHAVGLTPWVESSFAELSALTGDQFFSIRRADGAIERLASILRAEFGNLDLDRRVLAARREGPSLSVAELATRLDASRHAVSTALVRLRSRDLVDAR
jgi:hypothetical protein